MITVIFLSPTGNVWFSSRLPELASVKVSNIVIIHRNTKTPAEYFNKLSLSKNYSIHYRVEITLLTFQYPCRFRSIPKLVLPLIGKMAVIAPTNKTKKNFQHAWSGSLHSILSSALTILPLIDVTNGLTKGNKTDLYTGEYSVFGDLQRCDDCIQLKQRFPNKETCL